MKVAPVSFAVRIAAGDRARLSGGQGAPGRDPRGKSVPVMRGKRGFTGRSARGDNARLRG